MPRQRRKDYQGLLIVDYIVPPFGQNRHTQLNAEIVSGLLNPAVTLDLEPVILAPLPQQRSRKLIQERFMKEGLALTHPLRIVRATYLSNLAGILEKLVESTGIDPERCFYFKANPFGPESLASARIATGLRMRASFFGGVHETTNTIAAERFLETYAGYNVFIGHRPILDMLSDFRRSFRTGRRPIHRMSTPAAMARLA